MNAHCTKVITVRSASSTISSLQSLDLRLMTVIENRMIVELWGRASCNPQNLTSTSSWTSRYCFLYKTKPQDWDIHDWILRPLLPHHSILRTVNYVIVLAIESALVGDA
jgi:hypothetical protein